MTLTPEQLRQNAAAMLAFADGKPIEVMSPQHNEVAWSEVNPDDVSWNFKLNIYRPKPMPVTRPWSKPKDVPAYCWLRCGYEYEFQVIGVNKDGVVIAGLDPSFKPELRLRTFDTIQKTGDEYSTDRESWRKCEVSE